MKNNKKRMSECAIPEYATLIDVTFKSLKMLGGSGKNKEIEAKAIELLDLNETALSMLHVNSSLPEINYRLAWARTLLKNYGAIENSSRAVWNITTKFSNIEAVDGNYIERNCKNVSLINNKNSTKEQQMEEAGVDVPEEVKPWRSKLYNVLINMNAYAFERLAQRLLRECGFDDVCVTKKSGDGGIDGTGKLKINGIFSFNVAFQCKRYKGTVGASEIRDFRGSLTAGIEKGVFITTGSFTKQAIEEASNIGKQQIDLIDGEDFITKLAEFGIGVKEVKDYEIDEEYFSNI